ncbi:MAG: T9SS type A sorting domain-containing protein [Cytophagaceae bacterium]|nr:T9SS type A sorting domain-containing protein [Cytophagaceae bacterium]
MKKLILYVSAFLLFGFANAQGWGTTGAHDDFATGTQYTNGANGQGLYWFDLTGGDTLAVSRPGTGYMNVAVTTAGSCNYSSTGGVNVGKCYPIFGVDFGNDGAIPTPNPHTVDLSGGANIVLDIENMNATQMVYISIQLVDINNNRSEYEPNISDVTSTSWTTAGPDRKALNGLTLTGGQRKTITIDLSSVPGSVGGLTVVNYNCNGPADCPTTTYSINPAQIKAVLFQVNFGKDDINISEALPYTTETFIAGASIQPFTGNIRVHDFKIGTVTTGLNEAVINNSLSVYPNPANEALNVSFNAPEGAEVVLSDILGNQVFSATAASGENKIPVNTAELPAGMYILTVATENGTVVRKVNIK